MNQALRWMLILGCLMLAVLEAPRSSALLVEDLGGPYAEPLAARAAGPELSPRARHAQLESDTLPTDALAEAATK